MSWVITGYLNNYRSVPNHTCKWLTVTWFVSKARQQRRYHISQQSIKWSQLEVELCFTEPRRLVNSDNWTLLTWQWIMVMPFLILFSIVRCTYASWCGIALVVFKTGVLFISVYHIWSYLFQVMKNMRIATADYHTPSSFHGNPEVLGEVVEATAFIVTLFWLRHSATTQSRSPPLQPSSRFWDCITEPLKDLNIVSDLICGSLKGICRR